MKLMAEIQELVGFLEDKNEQVVWLALQHLAGLSVTEEGKRQLSTPAAIEPLIKLVKFENFTNIQQVRAKVIVQGNISRLALTTAINLSEEETVRKLMINSETLFPILIEAILDESHPLAELNGMLLSNLTHGVDGARRLLEGEHNAAQLAAVFARGPLHPPADPTSWIATILQNLSSIEEGQ